MSNRDNEQLFLTQEELAWRWRISGRTLEGWRLKGIGPTYVRVGSRVIYSLEAIHRFEATGTMLLGANHG